MAAMGIDFEAEGLLDGVEGEAREARLDLLRGLAADGVPLEELRSAISEERLALLPVERVLEGEGERLTGAELSERSGLELEFLVRQRQALGLPVAEPDSQVFSEQDLQAAVRLRELREAGLPEDGMLEIARVLGMTMSQLAAATRGMIVEAFIDAGANERDVALRLAGAARELRPHIAQALEYTLDLHLREQIRSDVLSRTELASGATGTQEVTAGFADLVDFTRLGEQLPPEELGHVTERLGKVVAGVISSPVRLVKMVGDAAMFVSPDGEAAMSAAIDLVAAAEAEDDDFPELRAGLAHGVALPRGGDWYGRPINMAARITGIARPGSVLASETAREAAGEGFDYSYAGERRLKGIKGEVKLFRARHPEDGD
jgi:adenylate cyclase